MAQTTLSAITILKSKSLIKSHDYFITSLLIGSIIPDLDILLNFFVNQNINNVFFHSLFSVPFFTLLILIFGEYKKIYKSKRIAFGFNLGIIIHIIFDLITLESVGIFYPLFNSYENLDFKNIVNFKLNKTTILIFNSFDFLMFRIYGWMLIEQIILNPKKNTKYIKYIRMWMKFELYIFVLFILLIYFRIGDSSIKNIYTLFMMPSIIITLFFTYKLRKTLK
tara:strand:+ start:4833 stop:5501 length:669 start_codon:yes stop_codon:yes gene_type:complete